MSIEREIESKLSQYSGKQVKILKFAPVSGGCINLSQKLSTTEGNFFIKQNDALLYPGMFESEAKGLKILASANTIHVPEVIAFGESGNQSYLILEWIQSSGRNKKFWENFGERLAHVHKFTSEYFGLEHDNYIGSLPQRNHQHTDWTIFFIEERLKPQVQLALTNGFLKPLHQGQFERLYQNLESFFPDEPPSLLHGDLWSGNFMCGEDGEICLIDPAVYFGHREMEIAFTRLFGGFDERFYAAYHAAFPLQPGFDIRADVCNLYPLLVHLNLFGTSYLSGVERALKMFL